MLAASDVASVLTSLIGGELAVFNKSTIEKVTLDEVRLSSSKRYLGSPKQVVLFHARGTMEVR